MGGVCSVRLPEAMTGFPSLQLGKTMASEVQVWADNDSLAWKVWSTEIHTHTHRRLLGLCFGGIGTKDWSKLDVALLNTARTVRPFEQIE
jgi:hypothetical protein